MKKTTLLLLLLFILSSISNTAFSKGKNNTRKQIRKNRQNIDKQTPRKNLRPSEMLKQRRTKLRETKHRRQAEINANRNANDPAEFHKQKEAFKKQMIHEEAKHRRRKARLGHIRQLALEQNATETVQRVDKLLEKELTHHTNKLNRMRQRTRPSLRAPGRETRRPDRMSPIKPVKQKPAE